MNEEQTRIIYERQFGPFVHMGNEDKAIWLRFLARGGVRFAPFQYDIRVGDGTPLPITATATERSVAAALTTKRIDVLWFVEDTPIICEVKKRAGTTAIGQLIVYSQLYWQTFPNQREPRRVLVTDELQPDLVDSLIEHEITYYEVGL